MTKSKLAKPNQIEDTDEAWDSRELGADKSQVQILSDDELEVDEGLELQMISIRLPKALIEDFKMIADYHGNSYQPLMRQILKRFAVSELKLIARTLMSKEKNGAEIEDIDSVEGQLVA